MSVSSSYSNDVASLHKAIEESDIDEVKKLLSRLSVDKHFYDAKNSSAAAVAIKWEKHEIYELLVAKGIFLGPHEWMDEATSGQEKSQKISLREIHRKYFNDPNLRHLVNLITSTKLSHEASPSDRREHLRLITEVFEDLNDLKSIEPILKVASTSPKLRIVFDFNRDSVEFLDPVKNRNVMGTSYTESCIIYVGATDLKEKDKRYEVLGVLIHELTHFVMKLLYDNESKPYHPGDQEKLNKFSQVVEKTAKIIVETEVKKESEPYIKSVYNYPVSRHHAELIARVPQLTALFKDDEDKSIEVQDEFSELFDFYEENTLVDLKREFPLMEVKQEIRELNELCGILAIYEKSDIEMSLQALDGLDLNSLSNNKILFISSNCPQLTLSAILQQVRTEINFETSFIFADLKSMGNDKIFGLVVKALEMVTNPRLIIDCQVVVKYDEVMGIVKKLNENKINQKVIFIIDEKLKDSCNAKAFEVVHSWNHLASTIQQELLRKKIEFHGTKMVIGELLNDLSSIASIPFQDLLDGKTIVIGKNLEFETEKLIERKFLPPNSEIIHDDVSRYGWAYNVDLEDNSQNYTIEHDLDELLTVTKDHKTILISDKPGMGKSTSFKMLHSKLKQKNPSLWLIFMDLKDYFKAFQVSCLEVHKREDIAKFFTEKVLVIESLEAEIFKQLFNEDRVVLLMDGLDEICPSYKRFIFSLMKDIQKFSKNQLWISTRPHLVAELKQELNPIEFSLKPFTKANRFEFFEKHFIGDPNFELLLEEIESFLKKLKCRNPWFFNPKSEDVCNPLVMRMIVEILDEDRSLKLSEANLFVVYDRFTRKMIERCQGKGSEARRDIARSFESIVEFNQQQAFLTCFSDQYDARNEKGATLLRKKLIDPQFDHVEKPSLNEVARIGLMFASSPEKLYFIHRTFAEFYVAKFFYEVIFKFTNLRAEKHVKATIEFLLKKVLDGYGFHFITILLDNVIDSNKTLTVEKIPPSTLKVVKQNMKRRNFEHLVRCGCYNLIEIFVLHSHPNVQKLLFSGAYFFFSNLVMVAVDSESLDFVKRFLNLIKDLNTHELKKMLFQQDRFGPNVLYFAALNPNSGVFEYICDLCESFMTSKNLNELLMQKYEIIHNPRKTNILHSAIMCRRQVDIIIEVLTLKLSPAQQKTMLVGVSPPDGSNLLQFAVETQNSIANCKCLLAFVRKVLDPQDFEKFLLHENKRGLKVFDLELLKEGKLIFGATRNFYLEVFGEEMMRKISFSKNWLEKSSLYFRQIYCIYWKYDGAFKMFISFIMKLLAADCIPKEFFLIKDDDCGTFLEFAMMILEEDDFVFFCALLKKIDRVEILQQKNPRDECAFHSAAKLDNLARFHKICQLYDESFNKQTFRKMIVSCNKSWLLDVVKCLNYKTFAELCHCLSELFKGADETKTLKPFFLFADETGQTAFMVAAIGKSDEFEDFFALTKELYGIETVKKCLLRKDTDGKTAFSYSFASGNNTTFEFVKHIFEELFGQQKVQELVMAKVNNQNILWYTINNWYIFQPGSFEKVCNFLIKLFEGDAQMLKYFFVSVDHDRTVLMKAAEQSSSYYFEVLVNVIEKLFAEEDFMEILCQKNRQGKTAFHFSIENKQEEIFEIVKNFHFKTLRKEAMENILSAEVDWTSIIDEYNLIKTIKRLLPVLKSLFTEVNFKNIFFKIFSEKTINASMKVGSQESKESLIFYLIEQFQDDEQMKKFITEFESSSDLVSITDSDKYSKSCTVI